MTESFADSINIAFYNLLLIQFSDDIKKSAIIHVPDEFRRRNVTICLMFRFRARYEFRRRIGERVINHRQTEAVKNQTQTFNNSQKTER